eukprot:1630433-Pleurochrysis_carterae.AAC.2
MKLSQEQGRSLSQFAALRKRLHNAWLAMFAKCCALSVHSRVGLWFLELAQTVSCCVASVCTRERAAT